MEDQTLKLELLRLAVARLQGDPASSVKELANLWYEWATGRDEKVQVEQGKSDSAPKAKAATYEELVAYVKGRTDQFIGAPHNPYYTYPCKIVKSP